MLNEIGLESILKLIETMVGKILSFTFSPLFGGVQKNIHHEIIKNNYQIQNLQKQLDFHNFVGVNIVFITI